MLAGTPFTVAASGSTNVSINFAPLLSGNFTNTVILVSDGGGSSNSVAGRAVASPLILGPLLAGTNFTFSFATEPGFSYVIQFKNAIADPSWQTLQTETGDGGPKTFSLPLADAPQRFYRILVE